MPTPHSHDGFEETIYGLEGVSTSTTAGEVDCEAGAAPSQLDGSGRLSRFVRSVGVAGEWRCATEIALWRWCLGAGCARGQGIPDKLATMWNALARERNRE
jgi:hypothetical protein